MSEEMVKSFDGTKLFMNKQVTGKEKCVCVVVHGLCEHQGRYDYLAEKFHQAGIGTYRFDHRGHGKSEGEIAHYNDYNDMLDDVNVFVDMAIRENPGKKVFLLGHSMGGFAVSLYGVKYPEKHLAGIVTSGALTEDTGKFLSQVPAGMDVHTKLPNELGSGICSVKEVTENYSKDPLGRKTFTAGLVYEITKGIQWFTVHKKEFSYPVLMMHGEKDGIVGVRDTFDFFAAASSKDRQMKIYGNLFHEIFNEYCRDETIGDAARWILNRA